MFQNLVLLTTCHAETSNGAASAREFLPARTAELHVEIEARAIRSPSPEKVATGPIEAKPDALAIYGEG
jgi:hypothetical protein